MNHPNPMCGQPSKGVGRGFLGCDFFALIVDLPIYDIHKMVFKLFPFAGPCFTVSCVFVAKKGDLTSPCTRLDVHNFSRIYLTSFASRRICYLFHQSTKHPYIRLSNHGSGVFGRSLSFSEQRPPVTSSKRSALSRGNRGFFTSYCPSLTVRFIVKFISGIWFRFRFQFFSNLIDSGF